jgi:RNA polymerase sigma-70 factor (ECF subfamily)
VPLTGSTTVPAPDVGSRPDEPSDATRPTVRQVFDEHARFVWRTVRHLGVPDSDIADVCQDVFVTVHRKLATFEGRSGLRTWLYAICLRVCSEHRRRAYNRRERAHAEPLSERPIDSARQPDTQVEQRNRVLSLLDLLDDEKRAVLVLYEIEGLTMKEVAEVVGCPLQTAYSRLHAARERLANAMGEGEQP